MKILIVTNHQPDIPPFMISNISYGKKIYDRVYYVNTRYPCNPDTIKGENVFFLNPSKWKRLLSSFLIVVSFLDSVVLRQVLLFIKEKGFKMRYFKQMLYYLGADSLIRPYVNKVIKDNRNSEITIMSTWFGSCAYTAARMKKKFPFIKAVSLAHSYEILVTRNEYIPYFFVNFKHRYLDGIYFISKKMRQLYFEGTGVSSQEFMSKTHISYLGSYKNQDILNERTKNSFHICTCSRLIPLKRIGLLIDALADWNDGTIHWTHIGNGELYDEYVNRSNEVMKINPMVTINFIGRKSNKDVKNFYEENPVDLFLNLSTIEGVPISIMEAISYGIPIIATDVGGTKEIVTEETGFLLSSTISKDDIIRKLKEYYYLPDSEKELLRQHTFSFWKDNFNAANNIKKLFNQIQNINN